MKKTFYKTSKLFNWGLNKPKTLLIWYVVWEPICGKIKSLQIFHPKNIYIILSLPVIFLSSDLWSTYWTSYRASCALGYMSIELLKLWCDINGNGSIIGNLFPVWTPWIFRILSLWQFLKASYHLWMPCLWVMLAVLCFNFTTYITYFCFMAVCSLLHILNYKF